MQWSPKKVTELGCDATTIVEGAKLKADKCLICKSV